jgi:Holliday junction resolvase RusA-like endonuclease
MNSLTLTIDGEPKPKGRPRFAKTGHAYTPKATALYENWVKLCCQQAMEGRLPLTGALHVSLTFVMPIPKSYSKRDKAAISEGLLLPAKKPDIDNLEKAVLDGANGVLWRDDAQVVSKTAQKRYGDVPKTIISIREVGNAESGKRPSQG